MKKIVVKMDGMMCGMCESHVNDVIRKNFKIKKVSSSHSSGNAVIISDEEISEDALKKAIEPTGYKVIGYSCEEYERHGFFSIFKK